MLEGGATFQHLALATAWAAHASEGKHEKGARRMAGPLDRINVGAA
jgi:hypothetical protein